MKRKIVFVLAFMLFVAGIVSADDKEIVLEFTGGFCTFECYNDNTFKFTYESYGIKEEGTWTYDKASYSFVITKKNGEEVKASIDPDSHVMSFEYVSVLSSQLKDTFTASKDEWVSALLQ